MFGEAEIGLVPNLFSSEQRLITGVSDSVGNWVLLTLIFFASRRNTSKKLESGLHRRDYRVQKA
jgi:hypothetical protein